MSADEQFFASYGASSGPLLAAGRSNSVGQVKAWSNDLNSLNNSRYTNVDYVLGRWSPRLTEATRNFQEDHSLTIDGKVGNNTRAAMATAKAASTASVAAAGTATTSTPVGGLIRSIFDGDPFGIGIDVADTSEADAAALAEAQTEAQAAVQGTTDSGLPVPFLEQETWSGGPSMGKTLTIGGLVLGGLGLIVTLVKTLRPAPGMANRRRT
jgi:peptidoglycan hydrolase-like protein with peptidoglycan-binding domain